MNKTTKRYRAEYGGLVLWAIEVDGLWKSAVISKAGEFAMVDLFGNSFVEPLPLPEPSFPELRAAQEHACAEAAIRSHPDREEKTCAEIEVEWLEINAPPRSVL